MSQTPDQPGTPETPGTPAPPPPSTHSQGPPPIPPTQQWGAPAAAPAAPAGPLAPKRSVWREAVSTTGGKVAVIIAAASLGLVALLVVGLVGIGLARGFGGMDHHSARDRDSAQEQMPDRMGPDGGRGPQQMPPGQQRRGPGDLPGMGLGGQQLGAGALHGEAVIPGDGSATQAVLFQRGEVTDVSADKLAVKSTDGFSATYTIGADSRKRLQDKVSTLAKGDQVLVVATKNDTTTLQILKSGRGGPTT